MQSELDAVKPALEPGVRAVALSADRIRFETSHWGGPSHTLHDEAGEGVLWQLVELLDGSRTVAEAATECRTVDEPEVREFVAGLFDLGVLYDASDPASRYARHCGAEMEAQTTADPREKTTADFREIASLLLVGGGTPGTLAAMSLADAGVENVTFVRPAGSGGAEPSASGIDAVQTADDEERLPSLVSSADFVLVVTERPRSKLCDEVGSAAQSTETPWLPARASGSKAIVGPLVVPGTTACHECYRTRSAANASDVAAIEATRAGDARSTVPFGLRHVLVGLALDALGRFVYYGSERLPGRVERFDLRTGTMESETVLPMPDCPVCGADERAESVPTLANGGDDD